MLAASSSRQPAGTGRQLLIRSRIYKLAFRLQKESVLASVANPYRDDTTCLFPPGCAVPGGGADRGMMTPCERDSATVARNRWILRA